MKLEIEEERILEAAKTWPSAEKVLKTIFPKTFEKEYKYGDLFFLCHKDTYSIHLHPLYMLCKVETNKMVLININNGNRFSDPIYNKDTSEVSKALLLTYMGESLKDYYIYESIGSCFLDRHISIRELDQYRGKPINP